jgi:hypothetical protein
MQQEIHSARGARSGLRHVSIRRRSAAIGPRTLRTPCSVFLDISKARVTLGGLIARARRQTVYVHRCGRRSRTSLGAPGDRPRRAHGFKLYSGRGEESGRGPLTLNQP